MAMKISEAKSALRAFLAVPQVVTPFIKGQPGVGKSDIVGQLAVELAKEYRKTECQGCTDATGDPTAHIKGCGSYHHPDFCSLCSKGEYSVNIDADGNTAVSINAFPPHLRVIDIRLSTFDPVELKGLPCATQNSDVTSWKRAEWLPTDPDEYSILFLDEFPNAPQAVQNAALQMVYDRKIHTSTLSKKCAIVCAGNTEKDGAFITRMSGPLNNRLAHMEIEVNVDDFVAWGQKAGIRPEILGAVEWLPDKLLPSFKKDQEAQPTPRTWSFLSRLLDQTKATSDKAIRKLTLPLIGPGPTVEFMAFLGQFQRTKPDEIVLEGKIPTFDPKEVSQKYAMTSAVAAWVYRNSDKIKEQSHVKNIFAFLANVNFELRVKCFRDMCLADRIKLTQTIMKHSPKEFKEISNRMNKAFLE